MREQYKKLNFYRGRVQIRIEGFKIDKLIDSAVRKGIEIRSLSVVSETESICTIAAIDLKKLKKIAKSTYRITEIKSRGPEPAIIRLLKRPILIIGTIITITIIIIRSLFIATIEVDGYRSIPEESLRKCLEQCGIYEGVYRPSVDWKKARKAVYDTFPQVTWVRLVYDGRMVFLDISETDHKIYDETERGEIFVPGPDAAKKKKYSSMIATNSGYVESINTLWGQAMVEAGDYVKKGQVLISGVVPLEPTTFSEDDPTEYYVHAEGSVIARVPYRLTFNQERYVRPQLLDTEDMSRSEKDENQDTIEENTSEGIISSKVEKTEKQVIAKVNQQIRYWAKENLPENAEIFNKSLNFSYKENIISVGVTLEVRREITKEQEIAVGQKNSDQ